MLVGGEAYKRRSKWASLQASSNWDPAVESDLIEQNKCNCW
jgi:hypothetical protein